MKEGPFYQEATPLATTSSGLNEAFLTDFDDDLIKKIDGFDNVAPHHYRKRLVDHLPFEYDVLVDGPVLLGKSVISVKTTVILPNGKQSQANGTAVIKEDGDMAQNAMYAVREAQSVGLKLALTNFGMGLHLYFNRDEEEEAPKPRKAAAPAKAKPTPEPEEEDEEDAPPPKRAASKSASKGNDWASKRDKFTYPMGKNKGTSYADLEAGFLSWAEENLDPDDQKYGETNAKILKCVQQEIAYRKDQGEWNPKKGGSKKPAQKRRIDSDDLSDDF